MGTPKNAAPLITCLPVAGLKPYANNSRKHSLEHVDQLAASIAEFGMVGAIVIRDGTIAKGHGTLAAIQKLYAEGHRIFPPPGEAQDAKPYPDGTAPVLDATGWSDEQFRAFVLADNKLGLNSEWDEELLSRELADLSAADFDVGVIGFGDDELADLLANGGQRGGDKDPDAVPPAPVAPISRLGDVWLCGRHRLACGDSTSAEDVARLLAGAMPHLMVTDPPYGVEYDPNWRNEADRANGKPYGDRAVGLVENDHRADWREAWALFPGDVAYVWHADRYASEVQASLEASKFEMRSQIIWGKPRFAISRGHYHWQHEPCWYAVRRGGHGHWQGDRSQTTLWEIAHNKSETGHGTQKPVEAMRRPILNNSVQGDAIYEPFSGSGTTLIAAEETGRTCYAMELSPAYVDVGVRRWQDFTGLQATRESDGALFDDLCPETPRLAS